MIVMEVGEMETHCEAVPLVAVFLRIEFGD